MCFCHQSAILYIFAAKWSDRDPIWRDSHFGPIATKLGFKAKSDGEFFMEFSHFLSLFRGVSICTVEPNFSREGEDGAVGGRSFQESVKVHRKIFTVITVLRKI